MTVRETWEAGELARLVMTHQLTYEIIDVAHTMAPASVSLLLNVLIRLEVRCAGDGRAVVTALNRPAEESNSRSILNHLLCGPSDRDLRSMRDVAGN